MAVRPPRQRRPRRPPGRLRDLVVTGIAALVLVLFGLRLALAALSIATWTLGWRVVDLATRPLVAPLGAFDVLDRTPVGRLTLADLLTALICAVLALLSLAALAVRRGPR